MLKKGASGLELPAPKQWIWDFLGFNPTAPLCSTDSRQDRTDEQKEGPNVYTLVLKSQYDYIPYHSSTTEVELLSPYTQ